MGDNGEVHRLAHLGELSCRLRWWAGRRCRGCDRFGDGEFAVDGEIGKRLDLTAGPRDRDPLDERGFAQAEMQHWFGTRKDTPGQYQLADLNACIGFEADHGSDTEAI